MEHILGRCSPYVYALMRMVVGSLFGCVGARKLFGAFGGMGGTDQGAEVFTQIWFAGLIEFAAGLLVAVGLWTSVAAFVASGEMAVAYFQAHFTKGFWPILNGGERAVFYCFVFLYMASRGTVIWGLERVRGKR